jgi:hypothetical protein
MKNTIIYTFCLLSFATSGMTQVTKRNGQGDTLKTTIRTVFDYKPTVSDAKKLTETPSTIDNTLPKPVPQYLYGANCLETEFLPDSIQAASMKGEPLDPLYRGYVRAGAGNGVNYLGDLYLNSVRSRNGALGLELHGVGTQGAFTNATQAPYNRWNGQLSGKKFFSKHALDANLFYNREQIQYYGYDLEDPSIYAIYSDASGTVFDFKQAYQKVGVNAKLKSFYTDSTKLNHTLEGYYNHWNDRNGSNNEDNIVLNAGVSRYFGHHQFKADLMADLNLVNYVDSFQYAPIGTIDQSQSNTIAGIKPLMVSQWKKLRFEYGINVQAEIGATSSTPRLYPHLYAKYNLVKEVIIPYAGINGGLQRNNLRSLSEVNPFIWPSLVTLKNTDETFRLYGGFRGSVSKKISYNLEAARYQQRNAPIYVNYNASQYNPGLTRFGQNYFVVNYATLGVFEMNGELMYHVGEKLQIVGTGTYRSYIQTTSEIMAWQRPTVLSSLTGFYQIQNKIIVKGQAHIIAGQWAKSYQSTHWTNSGEEPVNKEFGIDSKLNTPIYGIKIAPIIDINIGMEYRYTERLSGFLNVNNLIAQRYQRWNQFPVQRFNILGGITYSFWKE